ncbi:lipoprotein insertase outer membrane protein LolB [Marilutibacter chinensis]|uniref:Outer-membrane lipoprotein LolB n=1 Tax=Marilutibacter chinensis TaxID=2912247 RepID=A0ABS9HSF7_9GAMM|nr:lipoprotein insertase outer membrane protein LolB [Lysobacter chinensis]MCF7221860.1 lipoprotein insertase outer membrane protein LolB [Lysobacter chinensis]
MIRTGIIRIGIRGAILVAMVALLAACAGMPKAQRGLPPAERAVAEAHQQAREDALRAVTDWSLSGRVAVSMAGQGGSGRLEWRQQGDRFDIQLSAPVTRQSWRLAVGPDGARLDGVEGGPWTGRDADLLLYEATGWYLPVSALADWARGLRATAGGPAGEVYAADGRLAVLEQDGWHIEYAWPEAADGVDLPRRIDARSDGVDGRQARVRLVVDQWQVDAPRAAALPGSEGAGGGGG